MKINGYLKAMLLCAAIVLMLLLASPIIRPADAQPHPQAKLYMKYLGEVKGASVVMDGRNGDVYLYDFEKNTVKKLGVMKEAGKPLVPSTSEDR